MNRVWHAGLAIVLALPFVLGQARTGAQGRGGSAAAIPRVRPFRPVTTAMLEKPDPGDWLHWRRTLDNWGYSPLNQINKTNVRELQLVWASATQTGINQAAPLVHDGVMYVPETPGIVQALDAATGDLLWEYKKTFEASPDYSWGARTRTMAIYGDKVYIGTPDAHLVALDARTGKVVWDKTVADYKLGYRYTSGPIAAGGKIVAGMTGCERYKPDMCFITGHDPETGAELWRTLTIAKPGEPGGESWDDLPVNRRSGGDVWIPGSYDPQAKLMYWSTSNPKPWARVSRKSEGTALYTNSVLALSPDTGKMAWYYQVLPADTHDFDEVFENILVDRGGRPSLFKMGKLGILWEIDRKEGTFRSGTDLGIQNVLEFDRRSGKITYNPSSIPKLNQPLDICPGMTGVRNWQASAYHPETQAFYIPIRLGCEKVSFGAVKPENTGNFHFYGNPEYNGATHLGLSPFPGSPERGQLVAMHITGKILWRHTLTAGGAPSALTTAGGLVVTADSDRYLYIDDVVDGTTLFKTRLPSAATGFPISYAVNGRQYLAVSVSARAPIAGNAMYVFALPEVGGAPARGR